MKKVNKLKYDIKREIDLSDFIYPTEYRWTQNETLVITINMAVVKASILNDQLTINDPEVIQLKRKNISVLTELRYLVNKIQDNTVEIKRNNVDINCELLSPKILPNKIQYKNPSKGRKTIDAIKITPLIC